MIPAVAPPGWSAFDPGRVDELRRSAKSGDAPCPFLGHDSHRLRWRSGDYRQGTEFDGDPVASSDDLRDAIERMEGRSVALRQAKGPGRANLT